jgi:hypothetical protein
MDLCQISRLKLTQETRPLSLAASSTYSKGIVSVAFADKVGDIVSVPEAATQQFECLRPFHRV